MRYWWLFWGEDDALFVKTRSDRVVETFPYVKGNPHKGKTMSQLMSELEEIGELTVELT